MANAKTYLKSAWSRASDNSVGLLAAGVAHYAFLAFVPLIGAVVLSYGLIFDEATLAEHGRQIAETLPAAASDLVTAQLERLVEDRDDETAIGFVVALALALLGARVAAGAVITAFNIAFEARESRGFVKSNIVALLITIGAVVGIGAVGAASALTVSAFDGAAGGLLVFLLVGLVGGAGAAAAYRVVPNVDDVHLRASIGGGALFAIGWMTASAGLGFYAANFANYDATYGSLGAIIVFLTWLFLSAYLLLLGAHLAAAIRQRSRPEMEAR